MTILIRLLLAFLAALLPVVPSGPASAPSDRWLSAPVDVSMGHRAEVSVPAPTAEIGTALRWATATWCAPTPTQCQGWGGDAKLAAVHSFHYGDKPYWLRVWKDTGHVDVKVVSYCDCGGSDDAIDLSPSAFVVLAALDRGRVDVAIEDLRGLPALPQTDVGGER